MPPTNVDTEYPFGCGLDAKSDDQVAAQNGGYMRGQPYFDDHAL